MKRFPLLYLLSTVLFSSAFAQQHGKFTEIKSAIANSDSVLELQLSGITENLPVEIAQLKNLRVVRLINLNSNYDLGDAFIKLSKIKTIEELYLYGNAHQLLPKDIIGLKNLKLIHLNRYLKINLEENIAVLSKMNSLEYIYFRGFGLKELPISLLKIKGLSGLDLGDNPNLDYEQAFGLLSKFKDFKSLNLDFNKFDSFPQSITQLKKLESLSMQMMWSKINTPEVFLTLSTLKQLKYLDISGNMLGNLPNEIRLLQNLETLNINGNGIIGDRLEELKNLLPNTQIINELPY